MGKYFSFRDTIDLKSVVHFVCQHNIDFGDEEEKFNLKFTSNLILSDTVLQVLRFMHRGIKEKNIT